MRKRVSFVSIFMINLLMSTTLWTGSSAANGESRISAIKAAWHHAELPEDVWSIRSGFRDESKRDFRTRSNRETLTNSCGCTKSTFQTPKLSSRIVGGSEAVPFSIPYQVVVTNKNMSLLCSGTLINSQFVMTAMHCVYSNRFRPDNVRVVVRIFDICQGDSGMNEVLKVRQVISSTQFPYNSTTFANDIAILKLANKVPFSPQLQPACLPTPEQFPTGGELVITSGWGLTAFEGNASCRLKFVDLRVYSDQDCLSTQMAIDYEAQIGVSLDTRTMMCAGYDEGGKGSCNGDSGGPLVLIDSNNRVLLVGIVSFGIGCAWPGNPTVYTKLEPFLPWIHQVVQDGECDCESSGNCTLPPVSGVNVVQPTTTTTPTTITTTRPPMPTDACNDEWYNDGYCDDSNNMDKCDFDGGDCCNRNTSSWNLFCNECECCLEGHANYSCSSGPTTTTMTPTVTRDPPIFGCIMNYINDGYCDDENNVACCNFDSGDCCDSKLPDWDAFCVECRCHQPENNH